MPQTVHRQCTLCEAHCGIDVEVEGDRVLRITGDAEDPISRGYICPKAAALADLYADPDRLRRPVRRVGSEWVQIGWDEALDMAADGLRAVQRRHGNDAVATYFGNPSAHTMAVLSGLPLRHVLNTRNHYSATSADQLPQHLTSAEMFGNLALFPIPDIDRTDYMLVLGANPSVSNGSLMTAPGARHRLRAIVARGGTRRGRGPAPHRDRGARLRARRDRPRRRSLPAARDAARAVRGGPHAARPPRGPRRRDRHDRGACRGLAGRARRADRGRRRGDGATAGARVRGRRAGGRVWARRRVPAADRLAHALAHQRAQRRHRQPRRPRRRDVPQPGLRRRRGAEARPAARLRRPRPPHAARQRAARDERRAAGRRPGGRDHDARRGPGPRHADLRRQPGALDAGRRAPRGGARDARVVRGRRHVRHRDDAPRERDPAAGLDARALRHRRRHAARLRAQPHPLQPGRGAASRRTGARTGRS